MSIEARLIDLKNAMLAPRVRKSPTRQIGFTSSSDGALLQLAEQLGGAGVFPSGKRGDSTDDERCHRA